MKKLSVVVAGTGRFVTWRSKPALRLVMSSSTEPFGLPAIQRPE